MFITNNHVINIDILFSNKILDLAIDDKTFKYINLSKKRFRYTNEKEDFTIIEILEEDEMNDYLEIDEYILSKTYENYLDEEIYSLQYPLGQDLNFSKGKIKFDKNKKYIIHNMGTKKGSSGCPIILCNNHQVIGIHFGSYKVGFGIFMKDILEDILTLRIEKEEKRIKDFHKFKRFLKKYSCRFILIFIIIYILIFITDNHLILYYKNGNIYYDGSIKDGKFHGFGKLYYENGNIKYIGNFKGKFDDNGKFYLKNGYIHYEGIWCNNNYDYGKLYKNNKTIYYGSFNQDNDYHGYGTSFYANENIQYDGKWKNDEPNGYGILYYKKPNETIYYNGTWRNGEKDGNGITYNEDHSIWCVVKYKNDLVQEGSCYNKKGIIYDGKWKNGKPDSTFNFLYNKIKNFFNN